MKKIFQSKTVWLAIAQAVAGIFTVILTENPELNTLGWVGVVKSIIDVALRLITSKPVI